MGTAFSRTFRNMFQDLSIQLWFLAFIFIILVMIAIILLLSGNELVYLLLLIVLM